MQNKRGKVIAVTSTKGGVGKTVFTLLLGYIYRHQNLKVLLVDMDLYSGSIALSLNATVSKTIFHYADDLTNNRFEDIHDYVTKYDDNIDILASCKDPRQANKIDSKYLAMMINHAKYSYNVIIIDTNHILDQNTITILDEADMMLYLMLNDPYNVKSAKSFMSILQDIEQENVKVILNESIFLGRNYFSYFDIKNIIKHGVDYTLNRDLNIKNIDKYIIDGDLFSYYDRFSNFDKKNYKKVTEMATSFILNDKEADHE